MKTWIFYDKKAWSETSMVWPHNRRSYSTHYPPGFSPGLPFQQNRHIGLQHLWSSLLLLFKWTAPLICRTCGFLLWKGWFQPPLEPDVNICSMLMFQFPLKRLRFFQSFLGSFWSGSCFWGSFLWGNNRAYSEFCNISACNILLCRI